MRLGRLVVLVATAALVAAVAAAAQSSAHSVATAITPAPAWTPDQLAAVPNGDWINTGGNIANQRYSSLNQINTSNVSGLTQAWMTHLDGSGADKKYSAEDSPVVYNGVMYVVTGNDDVFALDATTGQHLWTYLSHTNQENATVCCGWDARGVAIGDGKVFVAQLDGNLTALDQTTGKVVWQTKNVMWQDGQTMTMSPTYYNGMVYVGVSGAEFGGRGSETAYDANTGNRVWRFYTIPAPGENGFGTWPNNLEWMHGGGTIWNNPSIDPKTNTLIFTTGNADLWSGRGPGKDFFTSSFVALDATTGTYKWHYQVVHHDIWDYDCPSPTVQFDVAIGPVIKHGVAEACKTGWVYELNRDNGQPLIPGNIVEKKVPQDAFQHTWKTQPYVQSKSLVPQCARPQDFKGDSPAGTPYKIGCIFTPYNQKTYAAFAPTALGGNNWPPISYDPDTHALYACETKTEMALGAVPNALRKPYVGGEGYTNVGFGKLVSFGGTISAVDATTNQIMWQNDTTKAGTCYGGTTTTAGGLLFLGTLDGNFHAFDAATGKELWKQKLLNGADAPPITYTVNGKQYVAIVDGGSVLGSTKGAAGHGDAVYVFALPS
jgi:PQQ-dependent dehydrogenase (methanol/ethanol family)